MTWTHETRPWTIPSNYCMHMYVREIFLSGSARKFSFVCHFSFARNAARTPCWKQLEPHARALKIRWKHHSSIKKNPCASPLYWERNSNGSDDCFQNPQWRDVTGLSLTKKRQSPPDYHHWLSLAIFIATTASDITTHIDWRMYVLKIWIDLLRHYQNPWLCRVLNTLPSAFCRALGKENFA